MSSKVKSRRMQEVEGIIGEDMEEYLRGRVQNGMSVPAIAKELNGEHNLEPPVAITTVYNWFDMLGFKHGRAIRDESGTVHFVVDERERETAE
jgi:hypothetical protein